MVGLDSTRRTFRSEKCQQEPGYVPRPGEETVRDVQTKTSQGHASALQVVVCKDADIDENREAKEIRSKQA